MSRHLEVALEAVKAAELVIMKYYQTDVVVDTKADNSPVTIADREAEQIIREHITRAFPAHKILGEEGEKPSLSPGDFVWVIDPIDGTKSFIRHHGLFGTQLALMHGEDIILGVSNIPVLGELLYAEYGMGCYLNGNPVHVSTVDKPADAYMSYGSVKYFTRLGKTEQLLAFAEKLKWARGIGDCWSYHLLAQGKIDIMIEADIKLWDIAALKVIIEEAGGRMTDLDGSPIGFETRTILASNGFLHEQSRAALS